MPIKIPFLHRIHFFLFHQHFLNEFSSRFMLSNLVPSLRFFVCNFLVFVFRVITRHIFRIQDDYTTGETDVDCVHMIEGDEISLSISQKLDFVEQKVDCQMKQETEISEFDSVSPAIVSVISASNSSKFQLMPTTGFHGFIEEPEIVNCRLEELFPGSSSSGNQSPEVRFSDGKYPWEFWSEAEEAEEFIDGFNTEEVLEKPSDLNRGKDDGSESLPEIQILGEDYSFSSSDSESETPSSEEISEDNNDGGGVELQTPVVIEGHRVETDEEICFSSDADSGKFYHIKDKFYVYDEFIELEPQVHFSTVQYARNSNSSEEEDGYEVENSIQNEDCFEKSDEREWDEKELKFEQDYEDEMEFLEENQELIEQLKMEIRNSRTGGLPTILEEEEEEPEMETMSPKLLKPLKNDGKFEYKEELTEIRRVYKMYAEKMQKLDVLNNQTIHAIGLLKLKDPYSSNEGGKSPTKAMRSFISHNLRSSKGQKAAAAAAALNSRFMRELNRDLELVYVGHLCLSWELLHWQHRKALQLHQNDSQSIHQYNQVVNKFQLFCVLLQRFIEDERFHGPRIENYINNRRVIRSLLQVPPIREDSSNDKKMRGREGENVISTRALVHIIEDSMQAFREFVRADKDDGNSKVKGDRELHRTDPLNPADTKLMMMEIRADLQKKEKRLKEILRSRNCIVKKLQRNGEGRLKNAVFIAEVELRLVSRVMRMKKLSESQVIWCHKKLKQLNFVNGKVDVEPLFLLFPC